MIPPQKRRLALLLLLLWLAAYGSFAATRQGPYTTYQPFSGKIFSIDPNAVDAIVLQSGSTGQTIEFTSQSDRTAMAAKLNALTYGFWLPDNSPAAGGWSYAVKLIRGNAATRHPFSPSSIRINGGHFYCDQSVLQDWISLLEPS